MSLRKSNVYINGEFVSGTEIIRIHCSYGQDPNMRVLRDGRIDPDVPQNFIGDISMVTMTLPMTPKSVALTSQWSESSGNTIELQPVDETGIHANFKDMVIVSEKIEFDIARDDFELIFRGEVYAPKE